MTEEFIGMESVSHVDYRDELGYSLEELFDEYQKANKKLDSLMFNDKEYDPTVARMKKILYQLSEKIRRDHLFTNNEEISEVDTEDLKYLLVGFHMGQIMQKGMENRLSNLQSATVYLESFLHILSDYKVLLPMEEKCFEMWVKHQKTLQGVALRELKINRLRNEKECQNRLKEIAMLEEKKQKNGIVDEDLEREHYILLLQSASRKALDDLQMIQDEIPLLQYREKIERGEVKPEVVKQMPSKGLEVTKIGTDLSITKETIKAGVFKPWWELPSMSMADYAEQEIRHMKEEEEARKNDPGPAKKYKQLEEEGLEDDLDLVDKATEREREWDDWRDDHAKGIGRTKRI